MCVEAAAAEDEEERESKKHTYTNARARTHAHTYIYYILLEEAIHKRSFVRRRQRASEERKKKDIRNGLHITMYTGKRRRKRERRDVVVQCYSGS